MDFVEIYTKDNCSFCDKAKALLATHKIPYKEYKLNEDFTRDIIREKYPLATTYPVVVVDGFYIGGSVELSETIMHNNNKLKYLTENY